MAAAAEPVSVRASSTASWDRPPRSSSPRMTSPLRCRRRRPPCVAIQLVRRLLGALSGSSRLMVSRRFQAAWTTTMKTVLVKVFPDFCADAVKFTR